MWTYLMKDLRILLRDRKELALLLLMPFILISIFGLALGGIINENNQVTYSMNYILVVEDDEKAGMERFVQELQDSRLPEEAKGQLLSASNGLKPQHMLREVFASEPLSELIHFTEMELDDARAALQREEAAAIVRIPHDYTYHMLRKMLLNAGDGTFIEMESSEAHPLAASVMVDILNQYTRTVSLHTAIGQTLSVANDEAVFAISVPQVSGGVETVSQYEPIHSMQYYTFGMAVMYVLFVASSVSSRAYLEKKYFVFDRIVMAGSRPFHYLAGKAVSAAMIALLQMLLLFALSHLCFRAFSGIPGEVWTAYVLIGFILAVCVGSFTILLTALNFRSSSDRITDLFTSVFVVLLALLGGSFMPTSFLADWIQTMGEWTPNGAALRSFMLATQGAGIERYGDALGRLLLISVCIACLGLWLYPKRREA